MSRPARIFLRFATAAAALALQPAAGAATGPHQPQHFFPPWEGSGVYAFGPLLIDLNRRWERWTPGRVSELVDCSTEELFCLTARQSGSGGVLAFIGPRRCGALAVGESWSHAGVRLSVLARIERPPPTGPQALHRPRAPRLDHYLGDGSNPDLVYEYALGVGVTALYKGLGAHRDLVAEVRAGLDPATLPSQHRLPLTTFDRFAPCRWR